MSYTSKIKAMFLSRRFQATVGSVLVVIFQDLLGVTPEQALTLVAVIQTWVVGDALRTTQ